MKTETYDELFDQVKGLTWYPWVGSDYNDNKLLLIGESHYAVGKDKDVVFSNRNATVGTVMDVVGGVIWSFFKNTHYALLGCDNVKRKDREALWSNVAFYNFIQRPMQTTKRRPTRNDYRDGWKVFFELLKILKPTHCILLGSSSAQYLWPLIEKNNNIVFIKNKCRLERRDIKIGRFLGKVAHLEFEDVSTDITFIRHPSAFFRKEEWHSYLMEKAGAVLKDLQRKVRL